MNCKYLRILYCFLKVKTNLLIVLELKNYDRSVSEDNFYFTVQNYPLFLKTIPTENELKFYYTVHTSLDVVEEKISSISKNTNDPRELYLGLLYPTEDYKV